MSWSDSYYRSCLSRTQQYTYDHVLRAWSKGKTRLVLPPAYLVRHDTSEAISAVAKDHPELYYINYYQYTLFSTAVSDELRFATFFSEEDRKTLSLAAEAWASDIISKVPKKWAVREKAWLLFDFLSRQISYDARYGKEYSNTIIGPIKNHAGVCEGISKTFKFLCDIAAVPCIVVFGDVDFGLGQNGPHAWNIIECEEGFRHVDVTAELENARRTGKARRNFTRTDNEMKQYRWDRAQTPVCR